MPSLQMTLAQLAVEIDTAQRRGNEAAAVFFPGAYSGYITIRCAVSACDCAREIGVQIFAGKDGSEFVERPYEARCAGCGHGPSGHATVGIVHRDPIDRRSKPLQETV